MIKCLICCIVDLFCMHLVNAFTHLQVEKIPSKYILKCYTRGTRSVVEWDRNDMVRGGRDGSNEQMRFVKLVPVVMGIARAGSKSEYAYEDALERFETLRNLIETILANVITATNNCEPDSSVGQEEVNTNMMVGNTVVFVAPPISQTKGCGSNKWKVHNEGPALTQCTSTYKRMVTASGQCVIGSRKCDICYLKGHYSTTYLLNPARSHAAKKRGNTSGRVRKRGQPRTRRSVSEEVDKCMDEQNLYDTVDADYDDTD
jgi:hypothetical protein